jgi:hypothetical protein
MLRGEFSSAAEADKKVVLYGAAEAAPLQTGSCTPSNRKSFVARSFHRARKEKEL